MFPKTASCSCGQLKAQVTSEPVRVSVCHCFACQRRTGSVFGTQARFAAEAVTITGAFTTYARGDDDGNQVVFRFCPACGATVFYTFDDMAGFIGIPVGAFADPNFPSPAFSVYEDCMHQWVVLPPNVEHIA